MGKAQGTFFVGALDEKIILPVGGAGEFICCVFLERKNFGDIVSIKIVVLGLLSSECL